MGLFTARSRQNPFAERKRREREQREAEQETTAILADPDAVEAIAEAEPEPVAVPFDNNPASEEYEQASDISMYVVGEPSEPVDLEGGNTDMSTNPYAEVFVSDEVKPNPIAIPAETQAKIDAVMNHAIPPIADERPDHPGTRGAEHMRPLTESEPAADEPKRGRGRPRPKETIERDNAVHALLVGADVETGISKESIAAVLDEKEQQVYSSLRQLSKEGRAENRYVKPHGYRWFAA